MHHGLDSEDNDDYGGCMGDSKNFRGNIVIKHSDYEAIEPKETKNKSCEVFCREQSKRNDIDPSLPLFIRIKNEKEKLGPQFDVIKQKLSGKHLCTFVHRKNKDKDLLEIKIDEIDISIIAQLCSDECSLRYPEFNQNKVMILPKEGQYISHEFNVQFVDYNKSINDLLREFSPQWYIIRRRLENFFQVCKELEIPEIEIEIEKEKDQWQAYLEGQKEVLEEKKKPIKIESIHTKKDGHIVLKIDKNYYSDSLKEDLDDILHLGDQKDSAISVTNKECKILIVGDSSFSPEKEEHVKDICKKYSYANHAESHPTHVICKTMIIESAQNTMKSVIDNANTRLYHHGCRNAIDEKGFVQLSSDADYNFLKKVAEKDNQHIEVSRKTEIEVPLRPANPQISQYAWPNHEYVKKQGQYFVVASKIPFKEEELDKLLGSGSLRFIKCTIEISVDNANDSKKIREVAPKGNKYIWEESNRDELKKVGQYFNEVKRQHGKASSSYKYSFLPVVETSKLKKLDEDMIDENQNITIVVPTSSAILNPQSESEYQKQIAVIKSNDSSISIQEPTYFVTAKIDFNDSFKKECDQKFDEIKKAFSQKDIELRDWKPDLHHTSLKFGYEAKPDYSETIEGILSEYDDIRCDGKDDFQYTEWAFLKNDTLYKENENRLKRYEKECIKLIPLKEYQKFKEEIQAIDKPIEKDILQKRNNLYKKCKEIGKCVSRKYFEIELEPIAAHNSEEEAVGDVNNIGTEKLDGTIEKKKNEAETKSVSYENINIEPFDYVFFPLPGETAELKRQSIAMDRILKPVSIHNCPPHNPGLKYFLFDSRYAKEIIGDILKTRENIRRNKVSDNINDTQLEAAAKAVLAKDIAFIQGPPGTGKTTVIAEIIYQLIQDDPCCRILLTSQTNLAVDNALERLQGKNNIRVARLGRPDVMEQEGKKYYLPYINTWTEKGSQEKEEDVYPVENNAVRYWIDAIANKVSSDKRYSDAVSSWKKELEKKEQPIREEFTRTYKGGINLIAATCSFCGSDSFMKSYGDIFGKTEFKDMCFNAVIMDEASKATPIEMAVPLVLGKKIILVGDHKQLPPMMDEDTIDGALEKIGRKDLAEKLRKAEPQFKILFESALKQRKTLVTTLDTQYRSHEQIMNTYKQFYKDELKDKGGLKCGITETMNIPDLKNKGSRWHGIQNSIISPDTHAIWIDVKGNETPLFPGYKNDQEIEAIDLVLKLLNNTTGYKEFIKSQEKQEDKELGIITFYKGQYREINRKYKNNKDYRINVVDKFQGMERNIVIVSTVRSNSNDKIGFAKDIERINVAFSRSKRLLIVVGNRDLFRKNSNYATAIENMDYKTFEDLKNAVK